jgi:hypothetical protein
MTSQAPETTQPMPSVQKTSDKVTGYDRAFVSRGMLSGVGYAMSSRSMISHSTYQGQAVAFDDSIEREYPMSLYKNNRQ